MFCHVLTWDRGKDSIWVGNMNKTHKNCPCQKIFDWHRCIMGTAEEPRVTSGRCDKTSACFCFCLSPSIHPSSCALSLIICSLRHSVHVWPLSFTSTSPFMHPSVGKAKPEATFLTSWGAVAAQHLACHFPLKRHFNKHSPQPMCPLSVESACHKFSTMGQLLRLQIDALGQCYRTTYFVCFSVWICYRSTAATHSYGHHPDTWVKQRTCTVCYETSYASSSQHSSTAWRELSCENHNMDVDKSRHILWKLIDCIQFWGALIGPTRSMYPISLVPSVSLWI